MKSYRILFALLLLLLTLSCTKDKKKTSVTVTISPLSSLFKSIAAGSGIEINTLLAQNTSPHSYSPVPSDYKKLESSYKLFYVSDALDGWVSKIPGVSLVCLSDYLPDSLKMSFEDDHYCEQEINNHGEHDHHGESSNKDNNNSYDPHFWTDPLCVKAILPGIANLLTVISPENGDLFRQNCEKLSMELDLLNNELDSTLKPFHGQAMILFHPSFRYFLKRYGLVYAGSIELSPGKEPTAAYIIELSDKIHRLGIRALYSEPQIPAASASTLAESLGLKLYVLNPLGDGSDYISLIKKNAEIIVKSLQM